MKTKVEIFGAKQNTPRAQRAMMIYGFWTRTHGLCFRKKVFKYDLGLFNEHNAIQVTHFERRYLTFAVLLIFVSRLRLSVNSRAVTLRTVAMAFAQMGTLVNGLIGNESLAMRHWQRATREARCFCCNAP